MTLLKLLALQPAHQLHRDQVLDLLWPDLGPRRAAVQLYKTIHHVRQAFAAVEPGLPADALLELRDETVTLTAPGGVQTDVERFERLAEEARRTRDVRLVQEALACYRGDLLVTDLYEEWTIQHRDRLRELFVDLLVELGDRYLATGHLSEAADVLRQALARDSTREDGHRALMRVYARQGSRTRALRQYQRCEEILTRELGVYPARETVSLRDEILAEQSQPAEMPGSSGIGTVTFLGPLVGRRLELGVVDDLLDRLGGGHGAVLALQGEAGIGKTRLAHEILELARRRRWQALFGGAHEQEGQIPYLPFVEVLQMALHHDPSHADLLPTELDLGRMALPRGSSRGDTADRLAAQRALFGGVRRFLRARSETAPVVLVLDDLHVADEGTLKLFHYLGRHSPSDRLLLVRVWRTNEPSSVPWLASTMRSLERQGCLRRLVLDPLAEAELRAVLDQALEGGSLEPQLAGWLARLSGGIPLFAREMVRQLVAGGEVVRARNVWRLADRARRLETKAFPPVPGSVDALVERRMAPLSRAATHLLQLAAVIGHDVPLPLLELRLELEASDREAARPASLLDLLDDLVRAGLLEEAGVGFRFPHPLFREAVYRQMSRFRRRVYHGRVAAGLELLYHDRATVAPIEAIAFHYRRQGDVGRAVGYLMQAGDRAESVYDHDGALRHYRDALALLDDTLASETDQLRANLLERIGDVYRAIGHVAQSRDAYLQALEALTRMQGNPDRARAFTLHRKIALGAVLTVDMPAAGEHLAHARSFVGSDPLDEVRLLIAQALVDWHANQLEEAVRHAAQALDLAERLGGQIEVSQACEMLALAHLPLGNWEEGLRYERRRQTPDWSPEIVVAVDAHLCLYEYRFQGREPYEQVKRFVEALARDASSVGNLRCLAVCHYVLGSLAMLRCDPEASEGLARALELHRRIGSPAGVAYTLARQVELLTAVGQLDAGWRLVEEGLAAAGEAAIRDHCVMQVQAAGILNRVEAGDLAAASELAQGVPPVEAEIRPCPVCRADFAAAVATYQLAVGDLDQVMAQTEPVLQMARAIQNRLVLARLLRVRAQAHAMRGEIVEAEACLSEAARLFEALDDHYDRILTLRTWANLPAERAPTAPDRQAQLREAEGLLNRLRGDVVLSSAGRS